MRAFSWRLVVLVALLGGCEEPSATMTGRLAGPMGLGLFTGCAQSNPGCDRISEGRPLLLISDSLSDELRIFDIKARNFFTAYDPLFPLAVPVGDRPRGMALDPLRRYAFVANSSLANASLVDLSPDRLVEIDTDADPATCAAELPPSGDRCRAGVSRVPLSEDPFALPEAVAVPAGTGDPLWSPSDPLPVFVSLPGTGELVVLEFRYPESQPDNRPRLSLQRRIAVGGIPSGMAVTPDGARVYLADEGGDSVAVVEVATGAVTRVPVGGPSRRLALAPDGSVVYVLRLDRGRVMLLDTASLALRAPGDVRPEAQDPASGLAEGLSITGMPREITFVRGSPMRVLSEAGQARDYTTELLTAAEFEARKAQEPEFVEHVVTTFAYLSNMNGNVYFLDAENHRPIDSQPFIGAMVLGAPRLTSAGTAVATEELLACVHDAHCPYPQLADYDKVKGETEQRPIYYGIWTKTSVTPTAPWVFTWEGSLAGSEQSTTGRFDGWILRDDRPGLDFVASGVEVGDRLVVTSAPLGSGADDPCRPGSGATESDSVRSEFEVAGVGANFLELSPVEGMAPAACWPEALRYNVRANAAWTVYTENPPGTPRWMPRIHPVPFTDPPPEQPLYDNGYIALTMFDPGPDENGEPRRIPRDTTWGFNSDSGFSPLVFAPSVRAGAAGPLLPVDLSSETGETSPKDDRVYMLFTGSNAMMEFFPGQFDALNYILYQ